MKQGIAKHIISEAIMIMKVIIVQYNTFILYQLFSLMLCFVLLFVVSATGLDGRSGAAILSFLDHYFQKEN